MAALRIDAESFTEAYAKQLDSSDPIANLRNEFIIPTRSNLKRKRLGDDSGIITLPETVNKILPENDLTFPSTYLCGNSLGLQPKRTQEYIRKYLDTWAYKGVYGHFQELEDAVTDPWVAIDESVKKGMAKVVGAQDDEVAIMQTLTANLHLAMCSFYRPTEERYKIIIEGKAFPSDHYAVQSQLHHHNLSPSNALVELNPPDPNTSYIPTSHILSTIDAHASTTALILLPGIQYYSGQLFDIPTITAHARAKGITVGWDLAHAAGNVPLSLHDWDVDFACWCTYKYLNAGPGAIAGLFVHERHSKVSAKEDGELDYRPRLSGWWGSDKSSRFRMESTFRPTPGASGFMLSNPSVADTTAVAASLSVFDQTSMAELRQKSLRLTGYLEHLLFAENPSPKSPGDQHQVRPYTLITPADPSERGAQLSLRLKPGLLDKVMSMMEERGVVVDERRPDVVRVAPAPLYNGFVDVWRFVNVFREACDEAVKEGGEVGSKGESLMVGGGKEKGSWEEIK